jgi:hypothetical protein
MLATKRAQGRSKGSQLLVSIDEDTDATVYEMWDEEVTLPADWENKDRLASRTFVWKGIMEAAK